MTLTDTQPNPDLLNQLAIAVQQLNEWFVEMRQLTESNARVIAANSAAIAELYRLKESGFHPCTPLSSVAVAF